MAKMNILIPEWQSGGSFKRTRVTNRRSREQIRVIIAEWPLRYLFIDAAGVESLVELEASRCKEVSRLFEPILMTT